MFPTFGACDNYQLTGTRAWYLELLIALDSLKKHDKLLFNKLKSMLSKIKLTNNIMKRKSHMKNHLKHIMRLAMFYFSMFYYQTGILIKESYANEKKTIMVRYHITLLH